MPDAIRLDATRSNTAEPYSLAPLPPDDRLIAANQLPAFVGLAHQTLARLRHEGNGPRFVRVGRRIFYRSSDVREWLEKRIHDNTAYAATHKRE